MGSDMVVALPPTTADGVTVFGQNCTQPASRGVALLAEPARAHALGESLSLQNVTLPQARQTCAVLGLQPASVWGFLGGVNEHHVAIGQSRVRTRLPAEQPGLTGCELVRLVLERSSSARQAVDCLTDFVTRHGQGEDGDDHAFLITDAREGYLVETAGSHWAVQEIGKVRAVSEVCLLRQDWDRLSRGFSDMAISRKWWPCDGSKIDFAGVVAPNSRDCSAALRRWGQATLWLEQQSGRIDSDFVRRLLCGPEECIADAVSRDAFAMERSLCRYPLDADGPATAASLLVELKGPEFPLLAWCAFGPPGLSVYFPIFLDGDLPTAFQEGRPSGGCQLWRRLMELAAQRGDGEQHAAIREALSVLQARFDHQARETLAEAVTLKQQGDRDGLQRLLASFMQANVERFEEFWSQRFDRDTRRPTAVRQPVAAVAEPWPEVWGS